MVRAGNTTSGKPLQIGTVVFLGSLYNSNNNEKTEQNPQKTNPTSLRRDEWNDLIQLLLADLSVPRGTEMPGRTLGREAIPDLPTASTGTAD